MNKPHIIITSPDDADSIEWLSDGWYSYDVRHKPEQQALMARAHDCIREGKDVPDVVRRLEEAGFEVSRRPMHAYERHILENYTEEEIRAGAELFDKLFGNQN